MKLCSMMSNTSQVDFMSQECLNIVGNDFNTKTMSEKFSNFIREFK